MSILVLPGIPAGPDAWRGTGLRTVSYRGLAQGERLDCSLLSFVDEICPLVNRDSTLVGHDFGGVIAAMVALRTPVRGVILTGTALGPWWIPTRVSAWPILRRYFYYRYAGTRFLSGGVSPSNREAFLGACTELPPPDAMVSLAREMRPPSRLPHRLRTATSVGVVWGRRNRWYPALVARRLARVCGAQVQWVDGGHYAMWEHPKAFLAAIHRAIEALPQQGQSQ